MSSVYFFEIVAVNIHFQMCFSISLIVILENLNQKGLEIGALEA